MPRGQNVAYLVLFSGMMGLGLLLYCSPKVAEARPQYKKYFETKYPEVKKANKITCTACHIGKPKDKTWNEYGKALGKVLNGKKNVKEEKDIHAALVKIAEKNEKFAERLKAHQLPVEKD